MRKAELVIKIAQLTGIDKLDVELCIKAFSKVIQDTLIAGNTIDIRGFGSFSNKRKAQKLARHLPTNTAMVVEAHYIPVFKPSKLFKNRVKYSKVLRQHLLAHKDDL